MACSLAYTIMLSGLDANDSITSVAMESLDPALVGSADGFPASAFAYSGDDCCGGTPPNFFSSYPVGVQARGPVSSSGAACTSHSRRMHPATLCRLSRARNSLLQQSSTRMLTRKLSAVSIKRLGSTLLWDMPLHRPPAMVHSRSLEAGCSSAQPIACRQCCNASLCSEGWLCVLTARCGVCVPDQAPLDGSSFMLGSAEWPPPDASTKQGRYLAGMLADLQGDDFLVGVRVRTKEARPARPVAAPCCCQEW